MVLADGAGTPLGVHVDAASPAEVSLLPATVESLPPDCGPPERLIGDRGYDSNAARVWLAARGIELIERSLAWLQNFRRLVVRYEYLAVNFIALVHLACAVITLKRV
ncbi:MAG: transposase [Candidatus Omnitrophica bacterium]|nr:transposase [Candidatus Omnitrophota bacterium]